jgi:hypothetical protein
VSALDHARQHGMMQVQRTMQVDGDDLVPEREIGLDEVDEFVPAGVIDQDICWAGRFLEPGDGLLHPLVIGDVGLHGVALAAGLFHRLDGFQRPLGIDVEDADPAAVFAEAFADRPADRAAAAGDDDGLSFKSTHVALLQSVKSER